MDTISSLVKQVRDVNGWSDLSNEDIIEQVLLEYLYCSSCPLDIASVLSGGQPGQE
ncbi:MAG: hypothetical protein GX847_12040 [Clostridiales bacterium]|nr:hypothetical protein [Clostridiales bacterium]